MEEIKEFKRMNFFTGFFTTADDWTAEQSYHRWKMTHHNCGLHTPGILRNVANELSVLPAGGKVILVQPGAALDSEGHEIYLGAPRQLTVPDFAQATTVYVSLTYSESKTDRVENVQNPAYSGFTRVTELANLEIGILEPDNEKVLELARINVRAGMTTISAAIDPANPAGNEIDRRYVRFAGSACAPEPGQWLDTALQQRLVQLMMRTREDFAALDARFPVPSASDVRHAALTVEMLARIGFMRRDHLAGLLASLAGIERDTGQEIGALYPGITKIQEYEDYMSAVEELRTDVTKDTETFLNSQDKVAYAARELSEVVVSPPDAYAGGNQTVDAVGNEAKITLDASSSKAYGGRNISLFIWDLKNSTQMPQAAAGENLTVTASTGDEAIVELDASGSSAAGGGKIKKYHWNKR
jgi:hypothetical protein